jgi:two-component system, NtrC family, sensor kinase
MKKEPPGSDSWEDALAVMLLRVARGDFAARMKRTGHRDREDTLAYLLNSTVEELASLFEERQRQERYIKAIVDGMGDTLVVVDAEGRIETANQAAGRLLGTPADDLVGTHFDTYFRHDSRIVEGVMEVTVTLPTGDVFPASATRTALTGAEVPDKVVWIVRDIRELQQTQAQLIQAGKLVALGHLAGAVAHEINNPLMAVMLGGDFLVEDLQTLSITPENQATLERWPQYLRQITEGAKRCQEVVSQLLSFSRQPSKIPARFDLRDALTDTISLIGHKLRLDGAQLEVHTPEPLFVVGSKGQLEQVILNLLVNASQALRETGVIKVEGRTNDKWVVLSVIDNGCGIAQRDAERIFEPFYTSRSQGEGTGLGLSVSYSIVKQHRGRFEVRSEVGLGTTLSVILPRAVDEPP